MRGHQNLPVRGKCLGLCLVTAIALVLTGVACEGEPPGPKSLSESLPGIVGKLITWPEELPRVSLEGLQQADMRYARKESVRWITRVVDEAWLPSDVSTLEERLVLIPDEFDGVDTVRAEWARNGYRVRVAQTKTVISLLLTPENAEEGDKTPAQAKASARRLMAQVLRPHTEEFVTTDNEDKNILPPGTDTRDLALQRTFGAAGFRQASDGVYGRLPTPPPLEYESFWWANVHWLAIGQSVGYFTPKGTAGPWSANLREIETDRRWFSPGLSSESKIGR